MDDVPSIPFCICSSCIKMSPSDLLAIGHELQSRLAGRGDGVPLVSPYSPTASHLIRATHTRAA